jgi:hypothetical protein|tara:strand:+ start:1138 stop:1338 length:201 start_codon:yes stop_codon:yes gene_type:complete
MDNMTYINETEGTCATVTQTKKGFVVCFIDTDTPDGIVESRIFQDQKEANRTARYWVHGVLTKDIL